MNTQHRITVALALFAATVLQSCSSGSNGNAHEATKTEAAPAAVDAALVAPATFASSVQIPGELQAYQQVDLYAKVSSFVKKLYADVGTEVHTGQLLAALEAPEMSSQLAAAKSRLKMQEAIYLASKATYDRLLQTSQTPGTVSQNDLDQADARQKADLAQLDAAKATLQEITNTNNYLEIRAPFDGIITARNVSAGAYVGPSGKGSEQPVFTLQEQRQLRLVVSVPDVYAAYINNKSEVTFEVRAYAGKKFTAKVARLAGALDNKLRAQRIEMNVENKDKKILPGMVAEVDIPLNAEAHSLSVPATAVLNSTEGVFVIKLDGRHVTWIPVTTGRTDGKNTEVFGEIKENDTVLTNASEEVRNGSEVADVKVAK